MVKEQKDHSEIEKPALDAVLEDLKTRDDGIASSIIYYGLSGLGIDEVKQLESAWWELDVDYRRRLISQLTEASETNFELDYRSVGLLGLDDPDAEVRAAAIELLWTDESLELMSRLIELTQNDEDAGVRATAVSALGRFILLGEYEELAESEANRAQETAIQLWMNDAEPVEVRRRALEAISNSSHKIVTEAITEAYDSPEHLMVVSSLYAMGRSYNPRWEETVLREMNNNDAEIRYEAVRAAGELGIEEAIPLLGRLAVQDEREVKEVAIWSLGEIGGKQAMHILSALAQDAEEKEDSDLLESIEDAIASASLFDGLGLDDLDDDDDFDEDFEDDD